MKQNKQNNGEGDLNLKSLSEILNKIYRIWGYFMLVIGIWANGFMFGAIDRIIEGTSRSDFSFHFIITFFVILSGIIFIEIGKNKK